jgi:hypothetical protein
MTALWGLLATVTGPRSEIAGLLLTTPLLRPRHDRTPQRESEPDRSPART